MWCVAGNSDREAGLQTQGEPGEPVVRDAAYREGERATEVHVPEVDGGTVVRLDHSRIQRTSISAISAELETFMKFRQIQGVT